MFLLGGGRCSSPGPRGSPGRLLERLLEVPPRFPKLEILKESLRKFSQGSPKVPPGGCSRLPEVPQVPPSLSRPGLKKAVVSHVSSVVEEACCVTCFVCSRRSMLCHMFRLGLKKAVVSHVCSVAEATSQASQAKPSQAKPSLANPSGHVTQQPFATQDKHVTQEPFL